MKRFSVAVPFLASLIVGGILQGSAFAAPAGTGTIRVTIAAPDGIPATVALSASSTYAATKGKAGTSAVVSLQVAAGSYRVDADSMTVDGRFYVPTSSRPQVPVGAGQTANLTVSYAVDDAARDFHATAIDQTSVSLTWTAQPQFRTTVRRTTTLAAAKAPDQGIDVPVSDGIATDSGLSPGTQYTYALFAQYQDKWVGPIALRVSTVSPDAGQAAYVANQQTMILHDGDFVSGAPTGAGVRVVLAAGLPVPVIGAAVILPRSELLPGGFLGVVTTVATNGRTMDLVAGGLTDAFDFYELSAPDVQGGDPLSVAKASAGPTFSTTQAPTGSRADRTPLTATTRSDAMPKAESLSAASGLLSCFKGGGSAGQEITITPSLHLSGHFNATVSKYSFFGKNIPTGASLDMAVAATISGAATVKTTANLSCDAGFKPVMVPIAQAPVPISFYFAPVAQFTVGGAMEVHNLGLAVTAGVHISGHFGLTDGASFSGNPIFSAVPLTPSVVANGGVGVKVGGEIIVGPGAGTSNAGVIAGIGGQFNPIDASFGPVFPLSDPRFNACLQATAAFTRSLNLTAKAWVGGWDISKSITLSALQGSTNYPGSPWFFPTACKDAVTPGDTVLGDGVTKVNDGVTGGQSQWGYVPGFMTGKKTWVLSTGNVADTVGAPSTFASTDLGGDGDADLTALSGNPTYDAVAYTATLIPTGSTLHVRYIFASEEYPEFVGSPFNDVMAIYVNGMNCATVPGTNDPVSVNTINVGRNSAYYVDNTTGAAGFGTTMDGLTKPLECNAPVQIGKPVTVKITLADASDRIYDSAVALLDKGIWSD
jgi:hypothetical protein